MPKALQRWLAVAAATATTCLTGAGVARAAVSTASITTPADGTVLVWNGVTNPTETFTVSGTTDGTTGDAVDIDCYLDGAAITVYNGDAGLGVPVAADGSFTAAVPLSDFKGESCELLAVPDGTAPSPPTGFTGPRVAVSGFETYAISAGANAGELYDYFFGDATLLAEGFSDSAGNCSPGATVYDGTPAMNGGSLLLLCGGSLYNSNALFSSLTTPDLTRSEIEVDGENAYDAYGAYRVTLTSFENSGFPALTASLDSIDPSTGAAQTTESEPLVACSPTNMYSPAEADCASFVSTGVGFTRVTDYSDDGRMTSVTDTYTSTDGQAHTIDVEYDTDLGNAAAGWALPGQTSFVEHATGDTAGAPASAPGTIYTIFDSTAAPSVNNPVAAMTFASPYDSVLFDNTLWSGLTVNSVAAPEVSGLIDYQRSVPAGGSVAIQWTYSTATSIAEAQGDAEAAEDTYAPPVVSIASPGSGATVSGSSVTVTGGASAGSGVRVVKVNGLAAAMSGDTFSASIPVSAGANTITATVVSNAGSTKSASATVNDAGMAPLASTGPASRIGFATARLTGKVAAGSASVTYYFQYGPTDRYDHQTKARPLASGAGSVPVSVELGHLSSHTTYHYRLVATGSAGTSYGSDRSFQTRFALRRLTVKVSPRRAPTAPYRFKVSGSLVRPKGVSRGQGCKGTVTVLVKRGAKRLASRRAKVTKRCSYSGTAAFSARTLRGHGTLTFTVTFDGNGTLTPLTAKAVRARFG